MNSWKEGENKFANEPDVTFVLLKRANLTQKPRCLPLFSANYDTSMGYILYIYIWWMYQRVQWTRIQMLFAQLRSDVSSSTPGACRRGGWQHFGLLRLPDEPGWLHDCGSRVPRSVASLAQRPRQRGKPLTLRSLRGMEHCGGGGGV